MFIVKNFSHFEARGKVYLPMSLPLNRLNADAPIFTLVEPTGPPSDEVPDPAAASTPSGEVAASAAASTPSGEVAASAAPIASSQRVSAAHNTSNIVYNPYFWRMFIIPRDDVFSELYGKVLTIAKSNYIKLSETRLKSTFDMFSHQQSKQQQEDMFISFAAVGILSKLFQNKCVILVKGKTGLFLCADILKKYDELRNVITDDIDLVILANQAESGDPSRKIIARQVGLFISTCLNKKYEIRTKRNYTDAQTAKINPSDSDPRRYPIFTRGDPPDHREGYYNCSDVRVQGQGLCEASFESKNVKVSFQPNTGNGRSFKIVDITYTTYHPEVNRLYSRYSSVNISHDISYFYLDVRFSILEYVFIIFDNVKKCNKLVKDKSAASAHHKDSEEEEKRDDKMAEPRADVLHSAVGFMNMLTDFQQETLFKFAKSAYLCASIIRELPEFSKSEQKDIVMMQLYELSRRGIIPRKFTDVMIQTQNVLNEMLNEIISQKSDKTVSLDKPHQRLKTRLGVHHVPQTSWPHSSYHSDFRERVPQHFVDSPFDMGTLLDEPLLSPDTSPTSQTGDSDVVDVATTPAAADARRMYDNIKPIAKATRRQQPSIASASARPAASAASAPRRGSSSARYRNSAKGGPTGNGGSKRRRRRRTLRKRLR